MPNQERRPRAFVSCSLRQEDAQFVDMVVAITRRFGFEPMGTVGKFAASPQPIWEQMKAGIQAADCVVLAATPRYLQQDLGDKEKTGKGISEMLHVEVGMAVANNRPILAFALEGTDMGTFLPQTVQFIPLRLNDINDLKSKWPMIGNYFRSAWAIIQNRWQEESKNDWLKLGGLMLGLIGAATVIDSIFEKK